MRREGREGENQEEEKNGDTFGERKKKNFIKKRKFEAKKEKETGL